MLRPSSVARRPTMDIFAGCLLAWLLCPGLARANDLTLGPPQFLAGDTLVGAPAGMQEGADLSRGDSQFLAVWSDYRSTPDSYPPFASEGSGADIYATRLDAEGNVIDALPLVIDQSEGDQIEPHVAWNGQNWLVIWKQETITLPTYETLQAVRVSPDGTVLDDEPVVLHNNESYYNGTCIEGGNGQWLVLFQADGPTSGLMATSVAGDGTVNNPGSLLVHSTGFLVDFDVAFAEDEFMVIWSGSFDAPRARRYSTDLQILGTTALPFAQKIASDGTDFLVVRASGSPPSATVDATRVMHDGSFQSPVTIYTGGNQEGTCCADVTWDGTHYWVSWGGPRLARVAQDGQVVDANPILLTPTTAPISVPSFAALPSGGVQLAYNDGVNGAGYPKDVHGSRVTAALEFGNESLLSLGAPAQLEPDLAEGEGVHLAVFLSRQSESGRILAQRIDDNGASIDSEPFEVATGPIPGVGLPTLGAPRAAWNGSLFMVTWSDGLQVYMRRMLDDGTFLDATPRVVMDGHDPDVAAVGDVFLVVGLDFINDNSQWQATHSMRVSGTTGSNLDAESNALGGFVIYARFPRVESWGDRWLAVWQRNLSHDNTIAGTTAAIVDADGTTTGAIEVPLGWRPQVAVSDDMALFVAVSETIASANTDVEGILMNSSGAFTGSIFPISEAADRQLRPAATWNGSEFLVAWEDKRHSVVYFDERTDIYGTHVSETGTVQDPDGVALAMEYEPEVQPALEFIGGRAMLAASTLRPSLASYRVGLQPSLSPAGIGDANPFPTPGIRLLGARPNPAALEASIRFEYTTDQPVQLRIYGADGRHIRTLLDRRELPEASGTLEVTWDGRNDSGEDVGSGIFYYELSSGARSSGGRLVRIR